MVLLTEIFERPLDPGYAAAAARRAAGQVPRRSGRVVAVVASVAIGALLAVAGVRAAAGAPAADRGRRELLARISDSTTRTDALAAQAAQLRADDAALQARLGGAGAAADAARADALAVDVGAVAVQGPGLRVVLSDAPQDATAADAPAGSGRVVDRDLQTVVNGLWLAGAEAVAVNGQRLTSLSAIRAAGGALLVDYRPLTPPYALSAVGDPAALQTRLAAESAGRYLRALQDNYGIGVRIETADALRLPAASRLELRSAAPPGTTATPGPSGATPAPSVTTVPPAPSAPPAGATPGDG